MTQFYRIEAIYKSGRTETYTKPTTKEANALGSQLKALGATVAITPVRGRG